MDYAIGRYGLVVANQQIGILGGGQLARMLLLNAHPLGLEVSVFAAQSNDPASQVCGRAVLGSMEDRTDLRRYLSKLDAVTFESEFVDTAKLARCMPQNLHVFPRLEVIEGIQDRLPQKRLLDRYKIPTAPWREVSNKRDLSEVENVFENGFVLKQRRFGYDGYGTFVFKNGKADAKVLLKSNHGFIAEGFVPFKRELAISFVRSVSGAFVTLPLVQSVQVNSRCFSVHGPISHRGIKPLTQQFKKLMDDLDYVGVLAVELFDTGKELLVNELAPRVHNSAHYSIDALTCSQFEYHWRAGLDLPLPRVELKSKGFAMVNLLGEGGRVKLSYKPMGHLHWYGKFENRPGRKLGHITTLDETGKKALERALSWRKDFQL
ncbi:MAG: 5-(carboxyamino)imidazole ribonucleotide synthase [Bdellovibrionales bacterium]|nr:5-(carboxyamino)imidazole ribonucleotide synthase [Bdellovibrionales bacterium]